MHKILLFDFDGTIADTTDVVLRVYNNLAQEHDFRIIAKEDLKMLRGMSAMDAVRYFKVPLLRLPILAKNVKAALRSEVRNFKLIPGIDTVLRTLKESGHCMYVVSSNSKENIESFLHQQGIKEFDAVYSVSNIFGKHAKIRSLIKAHGWTEADVAYIGDEVRDIEAARKAKVKSVSVTWGYNTEEVLAKNVPDMIARHPSELAAL